MEFVPHTHPASTYNFFCHVNTFFRVPHRTFKDSPKDTTKKMFAQKFVSLTHSTQCSDFIIPFSTLRCLKKQQNIPKDGVLICFSYQLFCYLKTPWNVNSVSSNEMKDILIILQHNRLSDVKLKRIYLLLV